MEAEDNTLFRRDLAKLTDDRNAYSVVLRAIHRKVFL